jgi:hypothetical protein
MKLVLNEQDGIKLIKELMEMKSFDWATRLMKGIMDKKQNEALRKYAMDISFLTPIAKGKKYTIVFNRLQEKILKYGLMILEKEVKIEK